eukprot:624184-Pleurochrysis_carterae.AAC.1
MPTTRLYLDGVGTWDEIMTRSHDGPIVDAWSAHSFAWQNGGDVTLWDFHLTLARSACSPFSILCRFTSYRFNSFSTTNPRVSTQSKCPREPAPQRPRQGEENAKQSHFKILWIESPTGLCFVANSRTLHFRFHREVSTTFRILRTLLWDRGDASSATGSGGAQQQGETGGQGGTSARLLQSHRVHVGKGHAAKSGAQALQTAGHARADNMYKKLKYELENSDDAYDADEH